MAIAIGYVRVSTASQLDGEGLGVQKDKIEGWCRFQGIGLDHIEEDAGISGASVENRTGFRRALRWALERGSDAVVVVAKLDRLGRNALDVQETLALLIDAGVRVVSLGDGVDSASGMGAAILKLLTNILAAFAELEKETIRQRLMDGRHRADREGRVYASEPRYGRRLVDADARTLAACEAELAAIQRAKQLHEEGRSYRQIAQALLDEGHRPRRAETWHPAVVGRIVTGKRSPKKQPVRARTMRVQSALMED